MTLARPDVSPALLVFTEKIIIQRIFRVAVKTLKLKVLKLTDIKKNNK